MAAGFISLLLIPIPSSRAETGDTAHSNPDDLIALSIEELMNIEITSVSRKTESLANAAAAVFVITREDIRRSGVTSIPEALRMVPGLDVARIGSNKWAISARGFNGRFAMNMLVLFDGRTVYTPLFSGVFWDRQDSMLEDIERIEVIRGPGATLWGANAVNGVINIITKKATDTLGGLVMAVGGNQERGIRGARYGVKLGSDTSLRVFTKYLNRSSGEVSGRKAADNWHAVRGGFRMDSRPADNDEVTLQGDIYRERLGETYTIPLVESPYTRTFDSTSRSSGGNVLSRWKRTLSESSDFSLQMYYDRTDQTFALLGEKRDTFDLDFQHRFGLQDRQEIVWGGGYRFTRDRIDNIALVVLSPERRSDNLFSAFAQDDISIIPDRLRVTLGSKFEHNDYTGFEVQPNARFLWTPDERNSVWAAVSRAVRTPSRAETELWLQAQTIPPSPPDLPFPLVVEVYGSDDLSATEVLAHELGYRLKPKNTLSFDLALFFNHYRKHVNARVAGLPRPNDFREPRYLVQSVVIDNNMEIRAYGAELEADWAVYNWWRLHAAYSSFEMNLQMDGDQSLDLSSTAGTDPRHQFSLRSHQDFGSNIELDLWLWYVDRLTSLDVGSYFNTDVRLSWKPLPDFELSLTGQNLLNERRIEFKPEMISTMPTETGRSVFAKVTGNVP
ncbi:MAG: TonB-dependent receptor plug domain-containing protein [Candidatus Latescibacterota bacterium]